MKFGPLSVSLVFSSARIHPGSLAFGGPLGRCLVLEKSEVPWVNFFFAVFLFEKSWFGGIEDQEYSTSMTDAM